MTLRRDDLVKCRIGCPFTNEVGKIGSHGLPDGYASQFIEDKLVEALFPQGGLLTEHAINLGGDATECVLKRICLRLHAYMLALNAGIYPGVYPSPQRCHICGYQSDPYSRLPLENLRVWGAAAVVDGDPLDLSYHLLFGHLCLSNAV